MARVNFKNFTPRPKPKKRPRRHKKNLNKEPKLFHVKVVKSSLGVKAAKMGVLL